MFSFQLTTARTQQHDLIVGAKKHDHIKHVLQDRLHWLPVPQRVQFKLCLLTNKAQHGLAPSSIGNLCRPVTTVGSRQRLRSATRGDLVSSPPLSRIGAPRPCIRCGRSQDLEPTADARARETVSLFKTSLKTYFHSAD